MGKGNGFDVPRQTHDWKDLLLSEHWRESAVSQMPLSPARGNRPKPAEKDRVKAGNG
jgi:hypothetical protein